MLESLFWASLCTLAFHVLFLRDCGFDSVQVGYILAASNVTSCVAPVAWGYLSDCLHSVKKVFLIACTVLAASTFLMPATREMTIGRIPCPAIMLIVYMAAYSGAYSLLDVWIIRICERSAGKLYYSGIRMWGSIGYASACFLLTGIANQRGIATVYYIAVVLAGLLLFWAWKQKEVDYQNKAKARKMSVRPLLGNRQFLILLAYNFVIHFVVYESSNYMPYLMQEMGLNESLYSAISGLRGLTEVPILVFGSKLGKRLGANRFLMIAGGLYCLEHSLYLVSGSLLHIIILQGLAGIAYGFFLSVSSQRVFELAPQEIGATAQSLMTSFVFIANIAASLLGGYVVGWFGARKLYLFTAILQVSATALYMMFSCSEKDDLRKNDL